MPQRAIPFDAAFLRLGESQSTITGVRLAAVAIDAAPWLACTQTSAAKA